MTHLEKLCCQSEQAVREKYQLGDTALTQDEDVLDTWFSSALWTFATQGWPHDTERRRTFHPTSVLVTGFDIIFFWVARMIMMSMHLIKDSDGQPQIPFKLLQATGLIRDEQGKKCPSKGNVLDPLDMIDGIDIEALVEKRTGNMMQPQQRKKSPTAPANSLKTVLSPSTDALRFTLAH